MADTSPERIFATVNGASTRLPDGGRQLIGGWSEDSERPRVTEYVRKDLFDAMKAERDDMLTKLTEAKRICDSITQADIEAVRALIKRAAR